MSLAIVTSGLRKRYNSQAVLDGLDLQVEKNSITALIGPNGSGKSTLFNIIAGVIQPGSGEAKIEDFDRWRFSYVFQNYRESLLPWQTNLENVAFPLKIQGVPKIERLQRARELLEHHGLNFLARGYPYELSGGQQQMLAFMRALVTEPKLLLLDEPFSALDYENTLRMRDILQKYHLATKATIFIITHDVEEAVQLAHRIIIFSQKPVHSFKVFENGLPYPRTLTALRAHSFHDTVGQVLSVWSRAARI